MNAGEQLDALVAEKVMEWKKDEGSEVLYSVPDEFKLANVSKKVFRTPTFFFHPSTDYGDAFRALDKLDRYFSIKKTSEKYTVETTGEEYVVVEAKTLPLAICLAALRAMGVTIPE